MPEKELVIQVRDLVKVYGETRALDGITFDVAPGELFGFLGPNGAGKTTTIRILATLLRATAGTARVAGFDVATHPHEVRQRLGLAMQTPTLDAFSTGRETLELAGRLHRMPAAEVRRRTDELLELMGLTSVAKKLTGTYSGGMRRTTGPGERAGAPARAADPGRADRGARPAEPHRPVGGAGADQRQRHDDAADHPLHGRGGSALQPAGHRRQRPDRGRGHAGRAEAEHRRRHGGAPAGARGAATAWSPGCASGWATWSRPTRSRPTRPASAWRCPTPAPPSPRCCGGWTGTACRSSSLQMRQPSLDDVFMKYTGRHIREEAADQPIILGW